MMRAQSMRSVTGIAVAGLLRAALVLPGMVLGADVRQTDITRAAERHLADGEPVMLWSLKPPSTGAADDTLEAVEIETVEADTVKLTDVVPPIYFDSGVASIPESTVASLRSVLLGLRNRANVRVNLVGHADDRPLSPRLRQIYGDNAGLSRERAGQVAEHFKRALDLAPDAISFEWAGASRPIASNATSAGRALNRRVEVEVWYDELRDAVALGQRLRVGEMNRIKVCRIETVC